MPENTNITRNRLRLPKAAAAALLALLLALAGGLSCGGGGDDGKNAAEKPAEPEKPKQKPKPQPAKPDPKPDPGKQPEKPVEPGPLQEQPKPAHAPVRMSIAIPAGERHVWELRLSYSLEKAGKVLTKTRMDASRFVLCTAVDQDGAMTLVRENPSPIEEIVDGTALEPRKTKDVDLVRMSADGSSKALNTGPALLLQSMLDPVLPPSGKASAGESWTAELSLADGSFVMSWLLVGPEEVEGEDAVRIDAQAAPPGGVPCNVFSLEIADAKYWYSPKDRRILKAEGKVAYTRGEGENIERFAGEFRMRFFGASPATNDEVREAQAVFKAFEAIAEMLDKRMYARAEKAIDEFVDETGSAAYARMIDSLRRKIPDTRQVETAALPTRARFNFLGFEWRKDQGPSIYLQGLGAVQDGKPRNLEIAGSQFPDAWWTGLLAGGDWKAVEADFKGKPTVVFIWASWVPASADAMKPLVEFAAQHEAKGLRLLGITIDTEKKDLDEFVKKQDVKHPTVWDERGVAVGKFKLPGIPAIMVVDKQRKIRFAEMGWFGDATIARLKAAAEACLK